MRQKTFTILYLMRKGRPKKNDLASVYARITAGSLRQEFYSHCEGKPELWNQKKERMMGTSRLAQKVNEMLDEFRVQILDIRSKLLAEGYAANAAQIKQRYEAMTGCILPLKQIFGERNRWLDKYLSKSLLGHAVDSMRKRRNTEFKK